MKLSHLSHSTWCSPVSTWVPVTLEIQNQKQFIKMDSFGVTLQNLKEKTFVYNKKAFAMAVDEKTPRTQNTLLDENFMIKLGIQPIRVMSQRFAYAGISTSIVAEPSLQLRLCSMVFLLATPSSRSLLSAASVCSMVWMLLLVDSFTLS